MKFLVITLSFLCISCSDGVYTLYRNSVLDKNERIHIATFDSSDGNEYNKENCELSSELLQNQDGVVTKFWCEKGKFRK